MSLPESSTGGFDFPTRVSQLIRAITSLLADVRICARRVEPIRALADLRDAVHGGLVPPDEVVPLVERLRLCQAGAQPHEKVGIADELLDQLAAEATSLLHKPRDPAQIPLAPSRYEVARAIEDFVEQLVVPFKQKQAALGAFLQEVLDVLSAVPVAPGVMLELRSEIERLSIVRAFQNREVLSMRRAERELPILQSRLEAMLMVSAQPSEGPRRKKAVPQPVDHNLRDLKRLVRQFAAEERKKGARGDLHSRICKRLANHPRPPGAKWRALSWPEAFRRHPRAVRTWLSKAIHETD